jgi:hypothetical protein
MSRREGIGDAEDGLYQAKKISCKIKRASRGIILYNKYTLSAARKR